ncbi:acetylserotonin O-methyltransferase [Streptomyces sp. UNOC14_S4]|uniref:acetylserotonin O-methyltransferase n=1 Tax=Streptomyces sp. UNOC14_S4 TaxID=2872340 RepID=UPI001E5C070B|nr:acetylserotonin O-methyltransferase [Streptomyces sp. UNOC14_S4]MCC3769292.1 methyltransferase [Streptomyces sp. UNOC14_S4]
MTGEDRYDGTEDDHAARAVVDIITGTWRAQALHAAVVLRLADHVAAGHTTPSALAERTGATQDGITRLMRLLIAMGVFTGRPGTYRPTAVSQALRTGAPGALSDMVRIYGEEFHHAWGSFVHAVVTGTSGFEEAFGRPLGAHLAADEAASAKFQRAMNAGNPFFAAVPRVFDFSRCRTVVDVAGGNGALLSAVLRAHSETRGVLFDLPHVAPTARAHLGANFTAERYDVVTGDAFEAVPPGADVYLLSRVLQDWDDGACVTLLTRCAEAMPEASRLLVLERVVPGDEAFGAALPPPVLPLLWDLHLLTMAGGGQRTLDGYRSVLTRAGLRLTAVHPLPLETSLLVATREPGSPTSH